MSTPTFEPRPVPLPNQGVCDYLQLDPVQLDSPSEHLTLSVSRAVDVEGSTHAVTVGDQDGNGWTLTPQAAVALAVGLVQAHTAIQLDRAQDSEDEEAYAFTGSVDDVSGRRVRVGSQRFPWPDEPTQYNAVFLDSDTSIPAASIPGLVRLLMQSLSDACSGAGGERAA